MVFRFGADQQLRELPVIPRGASGQGSTAFVDFHSTKPTSPVEKCHLNAMVADTKKWEQSAGFALDIHPAVLRWVKNDHLGFVIPYRKQALVAGYLPDFIAVLSNGLQLIIETKGQYTDDADIKAKAAERWVQAMNHFGEHGRWAYLLVDDPPALMPMLDRLADADAVATGAVVISTGGGA